MGQVNIRKRGKVYQYQFETAKVNGKRTQISKSGFKTKADALLAGQKAQAEYNSIRNFQKVIKASLSVACYHYGYIQCDPSAGIRLPRMAQEELKKIQ